MSFDRHLAASRPWLLRRIASRMGGALRAHVDPEDILQEACVVGHRAHPERSPPTTGDFRRWMAKIADYEVSSTEKRYRVKSRPRRNAALPPFALAYRSKYALDAHPDTRAPTPLQRLLARHARDDVARRLQRLARDERVALVLRQVHGTPWSTIAAMLDKPSVASARRLHRKAVRSLRGLSV